MLKKKLYIPVLLSLLTSCISEYHPEPVSGYSGILIVDGTITDSITVVRLTQSYGIADVFADNIPVTNAVIKVEVENGKSRTLVAQPERGRYEISTGRLDPDSMYRIFVEWNNENYASDYLPPLQTPAIDQLNFRQSETANEIDLLVSTTNTASGSHFYRWTYQDNWEFTAELYAQGMRDPTADTIIVFDERDGKPNPMFYCWQKSRSNSLLLENTLQLSENQIREKKILSIPRTHKKISQLYHIDVMQYSIRKETYEYFSNLQKNMDEMGSIFAPIPSELDGNVRCLTSDLPVIGFVDVSIPSSYQRFISRQEAGYIAPGKSCDVLTRSIPGYGIYLLSPDGGPTHFAPLGCLDCRLEGGSKIKPSFWPNTHL